MGGGKHLQKCVLLVKASNSSVAKQSHIWGFLGKSVLMEVRRLAERGSKSCLFPLLGTQQTAHFQFLSPAKENKADDVRMYRFLAAQLTVLDPLINSFLTVMKSESAYC